MSGGNRYTHVGWINVSLDDIKDGDIASRLAGGC